MAAYDYLDFKCPICGTVSTHKVYICAFTHGAPDLDYRPPQTLRRTMPFWVKECPECGFAAENFSEKPTAVTEKWLKSELYLSCEGNSFLSPLTERFYKYYLICRESGDTKNSMRAIMFAVWSCDDAGDAESALLCGKLALSELDKLICDGINTTKNILIKADVMRRAGMFDELVAEYSDIRVQPNQLNYLLRFHYKKALARDSGCYRMSDVPVIRDNY